jgi:hypothetical protein
MRQLPIGFATSVLLVQPMLHLRADRAGDPDRKLVFLAFADMLDLARHIVA